MEKTVKLICKKCEKNFTQPLEQYDPKTSTWPLNCPDCTPSPASQEASEINFQFQAEHPTFFRGSYYPMIFKGKEIEVARKAGVGRYSGNWYLHVKKNRQVNLKLQGSDEIVETYTEKAHYTIELHNARAKWKEV